MASQERTTAMTTTNQRKILVIRHGESIWNVLHRLNPSEEERYSSKMCETIDCDITEVGIEQAKLAGIQLASQIQHIDVLMISPLKRALRTAELMLETFLRKTKGKDSKTKVEICPQISEVLAEPCDIGSFPDALSDDFCHTSWDFSHLDKHWWQGGQNPNETLALMKNRQGPVELDEDVQMRISHLKLDLQKRQEQTIVLVCHGDIIWWLTRESNKHGASSGMKIENGEIVDITRYILGTEFLRS